MLSFQLFMFLKLINVIVINVYFRMRNELNEFLSLIYRSLFIDRMNKIYFKHKIMIKLRT